MIVNQSQAEDTQIARIIMEQLGGHSKVCMMLGATTHLAPYGVALHIKAKATNGADLIRITLTPRDDYKVTFLKFSTGETISEFDGIYCDGLPETIEEETGLRLTL